MDIVGPDTRSRMMSTIRGRDTKPEILVRRSLHAAGLRFRVHRHDLPGRPDLVLPKWNAAIFVHGCFWHAHARCRYFRLPATRPEFWCAKLRMNVARDEKVIARLVDLGWRVLVIWECAIRNHPDAALDALYRQILDDARLVEIGAPVSHLEVRVE